MSSDYPVTLEVTFPGLKLTYLTSLADAKRFGMEFKEAHKPGNHGVSRLFTFSTDHTIHVLELDAVLAYSVTPKPLPASQGTGEASPVVGSHTPATSRKGTEDKRIHLRPKKR